MFWRSVLEASAAAVMLGDAAHIFPAEDGLFEDTFSTDNTYRVHGLNITIQQDYSASWASLQSIGQFHENMCQSTPYKDTRVSNYGALLGTLWWEKLGALHLCQFFESESVDLSGTRIIELGEGTGLVGIVAARLGAHVTITDLPSAVSQIERNIAVNTPLSGWPSGAPAVSALAWGLDRSRFSSSWDFVLGADIVYLPDTFPLLLDTLVHLCRDGAVIYMASMVRKEHGAQDFYDRLLPQKFSVELVQRDPESNINVYKATLR